MIKKSFFIPLLFLSLTSFSKPALPQQFLSNWLSPKTNELKFGFTKTFAMVDGKFWNYSVKKQTKNQFILLLTNKNIKQILYLTLIDQNYIRIGKTQKFQSIYTKIYNTHPDFANYDKKGFQLPLIKPDTVRLSGLLIDYKPKDAGYQYITLIYDDLLNKEQVIHPIKLDSLGRFEIHFVMDNPQEVMIKYGDKLVIFYVIPGHQLLVAINPDKRQLTSFEEFIGSKQDILFMGEDALLNEEFNGFFFKILRLMNQNLDRINQQSLGEAEYKKYQFSKQRKMFKCLSEHILNHHSGKKFKQYFERYITFQIAIDLLQYRWVNGPKNLSDDYIGFLNDLQINQEMNVITKNYSDFLRHLAGGINPLACKITSPSNATVIANAKALGYQFTAKQEELAKDLIIFAKNQDTISIQQVNDQNLMTALYSGVKVAIDEQKKKYNTQLYRKFGITADGLADEILNTKAIYAMISEQKDLSVQEYKKAKEQIRSTALLSILDAHREAQLSIKNTILPSTYHLIDSIAYNANNPLKELINRYKDKVIYIDFWAPWCAACINEMPASRELRKELEGFDVVFLYIAVNCTRDSWQKTIKQMEIEGEHYLLSNDEFALVSGRFQIGGIPRYMLVNKVGEIVNEDAKLPSEKMWLLSEIKSLAK